MNPTMTEYYKGFYIQVYQDEDAENPREWDNLGTMVCFHKRYSLGDTFPGYCSEDFSGWDELEGMLRKDGACVILPLYMYDHSGITIRTSGFSQIDSAGWDWGRIGFIFVTAKDIKKEYGYLNKDNIDKATKVLQAEVEVYNQYVSGDVWGYTVVKDNEGIDSCWGYFGTESAVSEAKAVVDFTIEEQRKERQRRTKGLIKSHVPLIYRKEG